MPIACPAGSYMTTTGADLCLTCTAGHYCITGLTPELCPPGFYCPAGTGDLWQSCPLGTFSNIGGIWDADNCTQCSGGSYCSELNATEVTGDCFPGYYCTSGSDTPTPDTGNTGVAGPCPNGHYCLVGTVIPSGCPVGTYNSNTKLVSASECTQCSFGMYCGTEGLSSPTGECYSGFYCLHGAGSPNNPGEDATGGPCPAGHFCPNGTSYPLGCAAGTFNPSTGQAVCTPCPIGYFCPENSTTYIGYDCPNGHYCPEGTEYDTQYPCPKGRYNPDTGQTSLESCQQCLPGEYCATEGLSTSTGPCSTGWYCTVGAWSNTPLEWDNSTLSETCVCPANSTGGKCQPGYFCPAGSSQPQPCSGGDMQV